MKSDLIDITVHVHVETAKAVLVSDNGRKEDAVWLPKSQIDLHPTAEPFTREVTLPEWLAKDKGLI